MALSQVDICNRALIKIGSDVSISSMSDGNKQARVLNRVWSMVLDIVLAERSWPFAVDAIALGLSTQDAPPGWTFRYTRPDACITAINVCTADGVRASIDAVCSTDYPFVTTTPRVPFDTIYGDSETHIVTDLDEAYLIFVRRVDDTGRYPPLFADALACRIAMEIAPALATDLGLRMADKLQLNYEYALSKAGAHGYNESRDLDPMTPGQAARGG